MKNKNIWIWVAVIVVIVALIAWAIVANNRAKADAIKLAALNQGFNQTNQPPTSTLAQILNSLFPFYNVYQSGNNNSNNYVPGGANNEPGTPLGDYCAQYPDSVLCTG